MNKTPKSTCVLILSTKSSGSSALQSLLCSQGAGQHVQHTRHAEFETLYWTKAASILGMAQTRLPGSEVPIPARKALDDLRAMLIDNIAVFQVPASPQRMIFDGWRALCLHYAPLFVEKSPHHLHQRACLELMAEAIDECTDVDFRFVGLVRNPMDVLYSVWDRWRISPEQYQFHWQSAYENLEWFHSIVGHRLNIVRYEDFSAGSGTASSLLAWLGISTATGGADQFIHGRSKQRWATDSGFGFVLDESVMETAVRYGYSAADFDNQPKSAWPLRRAFHVLVDRTLTRPIGLLRRRLRKCTASLRR